MHNLGPPTRSLQHPAVGSPQNKNLSTQQQKQTGPFAAVQGASEIEAKIIRAAELARDAKNRGAPSGSGAQNNSMQKKSSDAAQQKNLLDRAPAQEQTRVYKPDKAQHVPPLDLTQIQKNQQSQYSSSENNSGFSYSSKSGSLNIEKYEPLKNIQNNMHNFESMQPKQSEVLYNPPETKETKQKSFEEYLRNMLEHLNEKDNNKTLSAQGPNHQSSNKTPPKKGNNNKVFRPHTAAQIKEAIRRLNLQQQPSLQEHKANSYSQPPANNLSQSSNPSFNIIPNESNRTPIGLQQPSLQLSSILNKIENLKDLTLVTLQQQAQANLEDKLPSRFAESFIEPERHSHLNSTTSLEYSDSEETVNFHLTSSQLSPVHSSQEFNSSSELPSLIKLNPTPPSQESNSSSEPPALIDFLENIGKLLSNEQPQDLNFNDIMNILTHVEHLLNHGQTQGIDFEAMMSLIKQI